MRGSPESAEFEERCRQHLAWEPRTDEIPFQRRARLLQALWREEQRLPVGTMRGKPRGAVVEMPFAKESLCAFLTPTVREAVRREVLDVRRAKGKMFGRPRIFNNLLSSQPLCFNLFGELAADLDLASKVMADMTNGKVARVTDVSFEFSPGRGDPKYTGDRSAFDVFVSYEPAETTASRGFIGVEVKYHEGLGDKEADHRARYDAVASMMGVFKPDRLADLKRRPLEQIWRDHLLAGALKAVDGYDEGGFAFLYPEGNTKCAAAVAAYQGCLTTSDGFMAWTMEAVVESLRRHTTASWVGAFFERYLDFSRIERLL
ncbi:MAG: hypothetical protein H6747_00470 [Deltaproteobacteria bacterium]|nr:hypothetical protein [Deltaproteobacteria bacterium]